MHKLWLQTQSSVVSLTFRNCEGRISSGTGFKVGRFLVTNNHVMQVPGAKRILLRGVRPDGYTTAFELEIGHLQFGTMLRDGDPEGGWDYAVLEVPGPEFAALPSLPLDEAEDVNVGSAVALLGYQFDQPNQSMHMGYVSSQYERAGVHFVQLDCSVNQGNSGGPLVDPVTGRVIGIVTRKATGLTAGFDQLLKVTRDNIAALAAVAGGQVYLAGIDPIAGMKASQAQMEQLALEMRRSANVGIGFAYQIRKVRESLWLLGQA